MSDFQQQYKNPGFGLDLNRVLRTCKHVEFRREIRRRAFLKNRKDVSIFASSLEDTSIKDPRMKKLIKWREERKRKKKMEDAKKKPPFKVGIVHSVCSPLTRSAAITTTIVSAKTPKQTTQTNYNFPKGITKATEKRLLFKATQQSKQQTKNIAATSTKYPSMNMKKPTSNNKKQKSFALDNYESKPPKIFLFDLVQVEKTLQEKDFFIQDKSIEYKTVDRNEQKESSQKLNEKINTNLTLTCGKKKSNTFKPTYTSTPFVAETCLVCAESEPVLPMTHSKRNRSKTPSRQTHACNEDLILLDTPKHKITRSHTKNRLSSDEIPTKDTEDNESKIMKNLNISVEEEERTVQYFKFLLKETET